MATEYIINGAFDSDSSSWTASSGYAFSWDATGAAHDGGALKAQDGGTALSTKRYRMYQNIVISNVDDLTAATMDAWIQWADANPGSDSEVDKSYVTFWVQLKAPNGDFTTIGTSKRYYSTNGSVDLLDDTGVKAILQAGGTGTWGVYLVCDIYRANLGLGTCAWLVGWFDDLSLELTYAYTASSTATLGLAGASTATGNYTLSTSAGTLGLAGWTNPLAVVLTTDFSYYMGSDDGKIYLTTDSQLGDDGRVITSEYISKTTDFSEANPEYAALYKTVYAVRLLYDDLSSGTSVAMSISTDGGSTWSDSTKSIGTGTLLPNTKDFYFIKTGRHFTFKIEHASATKEFKFLGMDIEFELAGTYFEIS